MDGNAISRLLSQLSEILKLDPHQAFDIKHDEMLTMDELCQRLKIHRNTLSGWLKAGKFPKPVTICGQKRWPSSYVNASVYEENPQLREREHLIAEASRISCPSKERSDTERAVVA